MLCDMFAMSSSQCLAMLLIADVTLYFKFPSKLRSTQLYFAEKGFLAMFSPTFCASNRAPDRFFSRSTFCALNRAPDGSFSRATFCAPNRASDWSFFVQLFVLQIVLQINLFACNFCASNRAPDGSFRVQLFVLQIVLQMGLFARNFLCFKSCSRWVFLPGMFFLSRSLDKSFGFILHVAPALSLLAKKFFCRPRHLATG